MSSTHKRLLSGVYCGSRLSGFFCWMLVSITMLVRILFLEIGILILFAKYVFLYALGALAMCIDRSFFLERSKEEWGLSMSFASLLWRFQKMLMDIIFGNIMFLSTFLLTMRILFGTFPRPLRYGNVLL